MFFIQDIVFNEIYHILIKYIGTFNLDTANNVYKKSVGR